MKKYLKNLLWLLPLFVFCAWLFAQNTGAVKKVPIWLGKNYEWPVAGPEFLISSTKFGIRLGSGLYFDNTGAIAATPVTLPPPIKLRRDRFAVTADGLASFTLSATPIAECTYVFRNGFLLDSIGEYTLSGRTVNITAPVSSGDNITILYLES